MKTTSTVPTLPLGDRHESVLWHKQRWLLQAALLDKQPALEAWQQWRNQEDIETLDSESHHLLSLLYPNLVKYQVADVHLGRLKGVYRRTWYVNQLLVQSLRTVLQALQEAQISPLVLGEVAIISTCYEDYGQRPVYQFDVMVPRSQTIEAIATLQQLDWIADTGGLKPGDCLWKPLLFWQKTPIQAAPYLRFNLHNHLFQAMPQHHTDEQLWVNAVRTSIAELTVPVLSPVDQLLHLCLQHNRQRQSPIYWLADAALLINTLSQESDWVRLVSQAQRYEIILPLQYLLKDLQTVLPLSIPDWVLPSLRRMAISYHELLEYNLSSDHKLLLLKAQLVRLRQQWREWLHTGRTATK